MTIKSKRLTAGTLVVAMGSASLPLGGCEPVTTAAAVSVVVISFKALLSLIAQAAVSYVVYRVGDEVYATIKNNLTGESTECRIELAPGDVLEVDSTGKLIKR